MQLFMDPQLEAFVRQVATDESLKEKVKSLGSIEDLVALMKDIGFQVEAEILENDELQEEELQGIVGGIKSWAFNGADLLRPFAIELGVAGGEPWQTRH